jgi:hypothetical protein
MLHVMCRAYWDFHRMNRSESKVTSTADVRDRILPSIAETIRHGLEHYCRELNGWPRSWMGLEKDFPPGEHLVTLFSSFLDHLAP